MTEDGDGAPLVAFGKPPPYDSCTPQGARAAVEAAAREAQKVADRVGSATGAASWDEVVGALDEVSERMEREYGLVAHMHAVAASPEWDEANKHSIVAVVQASTAIGQNRGLYERMLALRDERPDALSPGRLRILSDIIADFDLSGVGLEGEARRKFAESEQRKSQLGSEFEEHVREATSGWSETVSDEESLGAMPQDMRDAARDGDKWRFSLLDPSYVAYMTHGVDRELRERMCEARNARASDLGEARLDNTPLIKKIHSLRWEQAEALGFEDPASMILSRRMAKRPSEVEGFLSRLAERVKDVARDELDRLSRFARERHGIDALRPWDMAFVTERYREEVTGLSDAQVRPYFGASKVMDGLFACVERLFGISSQPVSGVPVWTDEVSCLEVRDEGAEKVGSLYLDLYARESKRGGAWAHGALTRCRFGERQQLPAALMNCNFTSAAGDAGPRLGWQEVITLFHEAGHAFHHLLGKADDYCASGMNGVEWDAVELPSQFMESFAWRPEVAIGMSEHAETGEPMPEEMFAKLQEQRTFLPGLFLTRQVSFATYDLLLHRSRDVDPVGLWEKVRDEIMVIPHLERDRFPCAFGHVFAGGYATGYYGYLWADVLAADAYEMFTVPGADFSALGRRFSAEVLERGGTRDAADNFRALRGRDPDPAALLRRYGIG